MEVLSADVNLDTFFADLKSAPARCLMLDYDGTLAPFRAEYQLASPYPGIREILNELIDGGQSRIIIISGRPATNVLSLLDLSRPPEVWGSHGLERLLPDGTLTTAKLPEKVTSGLRQVDRWIKQHHLEDRTEAKPSGFAFHWRGRPADEAAALAARIRAAWETEAPAFGLKLTAFDGGMELRPDYVTKADPVRQVIKEVDYPAALAYLGDDLTDEDAFRALRGCGLSVLVRPEYRDTAADLWLRPPHELIDFLTRWKESGG